MTAESLADFYANVASRSRGANRVRVVGETAPSTSRRAQGMPGAGRNPWPASNKKSWRQLPQVQPNHPGIPCAMVLTLIARSPWEPGFLAPIAREIIIPRTWPQRREARTTRLRSPHRDRSSARQTRCNPIRPSHPAPNVRDDREAPLLSECGTARIMPLIWGRRQGVFCKSEQRRCDRLARRAVCAWRTCANCRSRRSIRDP